MSNTFHRTVLSLAAAAVVMLTIPGCQDVPPEDGFYELRVPQEKLRQIEPLDLSRTKQAPPAEAPVYAVAEPEMDVTLEQARALAMENNLDLKVQLLAPTIAEESLSAEEAKFESVFFTNVNFLRSDQPVGTMAEIPGTGIFVPTVVGAQREHTNEDFGVQVPLQTGGTITFDMADSRTQDLTSGNPVSYENSLAVSISQPLLRNAGRRVTMHSIRLAQYDKQIADNATKLEVIRVVAAADRAYWRLYAARRELEVRKQQHDLAQAQLERARRFVAAGTQAEVEIVRAEAGVARGIAAIITAENALRDRQREFKRIINKPGLTIDTPTVMIPATEPDPVRYQFDPNELCGRAVANRWDLLELELQLARDASTIDYLHNQTLPLVNLDYTYNIAGVGNTRYDSLDMLEDKNFENHRLGVRLVVPLGNEAATSRLRAALYQRRQRLAGRESRRQLVQQEVLNAVDQVEANWQQIMASRQTTLLESRLHQAEIRQFEVGVRTSTDVFDAQTRLADAQSLEIAALTNYQISLVDLAYATGTLLGAAKVDWEPLRPPLRTQ